MLSPKDITTSHRPVLKDRSNSNHNGWMTPSAAEDSSIENSLYSTSHHKEPRYSYGVPDVSPTPSELWNSPDTPSAAESHSPYYYQHQMRPSTNMLSPTDTDMYLDDEESDASSHLSSLEEASDMFTFATAAASILQQARDEEDEESPIPASPEGIATKTTFSTPSVPYQRNNDDTPIKSNFQHPSPDDKDTPVVKNTTASKNNQMVAPYRRDMNSDDHRETIVDWGKLTHPKADPSPLSLPSMLGEPRSSNNSVSELESPVLFLASSMGEHQAEESDTIHSFVASQATEIHSPKSIEFSLDLCQADPAAAMRSIATSKRPEDRNYVALGTTHEDFHSGTTENGSPSIGAVTATSAYAAKAAGDDTEMPSSAHRDQNGEHGDCMLNDKKKKSSCCNLPLRWKFFGLFLMACAVFVPISIGKWRDQAKSPTDISREGQVAAELPTVTPTEFTLEPTPSPSFSSPVQTTRRPTMQPTMVGLDPILPTIQPTPSPSVSSPAPTASQPVLQPTMVPTRQLPTAVDTAEPTPAPSVSNPAPTTSQLTLQPTPVPTLRPTFPIVVDTPEPTSSPSVATPVPTTSQPTARQIEDTAAPTPAPVLRPTSSGNAPIGRPSALTQTSREPAPTFSPIWSFVMTGETAMENANLEEIHWPHYHSKNGLRLELASALDDHWQADLEVSVDKWNAFGAIDLTIVNVARETDEGCEPVWGKVKICNLNYGETNWRGLIEVFFRSGNVVATSLRVNDFYSMERGWAQYTLCHQLGHAFGLGDSFDFNCMKPVNLYHDEVSIQLQNPDNGIGLLLMEAYGEVGERRLKGRFQPATKQVTSSYDKVVQYHI